LEANVIDKVTELRISRLENDGAALYGLVDSMSRDIRHISKQVTATQSDVGTMRHEMSAIDRRFEQVDNRFDAMDDRLVNVERSVGGLDARMQAGFVDVDARMQAGFVDVDARMQAGFAGVNQTLAVISAQLLDLKPAVPHQPGSTSN
jgi:phage-related tail protein